MKSVVGLRGVWLLVLFALFGGMTFVRQTPPSEPSGKVEGSQAVKRPDEPDKTAEPEKAAALDLAEKYRPIAQRIIEEALKENRAWQKMEELCDGIGHRLSGSPQLEQAVQWAVATLEKEGQENVRAEPVMVPHWVRGRESLSMMAPREAAIPVLGLGGSVATPPEGIKAEVVPVRDEEELKGLGEAVKDKIVLFNNAMPTYTPEGGTGYGKAVKYRSQGASLAARQGALAALVRSVTARSLRSPHAGAMHYDEAIRKIPAAAITVEDAAMIQRLHDRGEKVIVELKMEARTLPDAPSANVVAELRGRERPEEIVVIGGHLDSWDVGQGAHDDGGGCIISMEAINVLRRLDLRPARTIRVVLFTNEENGLAGGRAYAETHKDELEHHVAAIESDGGVFQPIGFGVSVKPPLNQNKAVAQLKQIASLLASIGATEVSDHGGGADIGPMREAGVPQLSHDVDMATYFDYHHSGADTLDKINPVELSRNVAAMAVAAYLLADMPGRLGEEPPGAEPAPDSKSTQP